MRRVIYAHERAYGAICDHMQEMYVHHEHAHYSHYRAIYEELMEEQSTIDPNWVDDSVCELFEWWHLNMETTHDNVDDFVKENGI